MKFSKVLLMVFAIMMLFVTNAFAAVTAPTEALSIIDTADIFVWVKYLLPAFGGLLALGIALKKGMGLMKGAKKIT